MNWEAQFRSHICLFAFAHANMELIAFELPAISFSLRSKNYGQRNWVNHNRCGWPTAIFQKKAF